MYFLLATTCLLLTSGLLTESLFTILVMKALRNNRQYIYTFLVSSKQKTLETYVLRSFFPKYIGILGLLLASSIGLHYLVFSHILVNYILILVILLFLRIYNRNVFSNLWTVLTKLSNRD